MLIMTSKIDTKSKDDSYWKKEYKFIMHIKKLGTLGLKTSIKKLMTRSCLVFILWIFFCVTCVYIFVWNDTMDIVEYFIFKHLSNLVE